jgi:hypothetical protein
MHQLRRKWLSLDYVNIAGLVGFKLEFKTLNLR